MTKIAPPNHQWVATADGSETLFSERFQEACHSTSGAKQETLLHYLEGCEVIRQQQAQGEISILEVGFGLGIGFLTTLECLGMNSAWRFLSLELDRDLLDWFKTNHASHPLLQNLEWQQSDTLEYLYLKHLQCELIILAGDARLTLPQWLKLHPHWRWQAIYQDAFSPRRNPVLWTQEWFTLLHQYGDANTILSTYSASSSIRKSLISAGWSLRPGAKFGPKRTSTRAYWQGLSDPDLLIQLSRSPAPALKDDEIEKFLAK
jgi:tRNA U34 5-methylaminomethyl-2-thiouridine-forming methyltransferase MnmC